MAILVLLLLAGSYVFMHLESWTWIEAFYFSTATVTTVGYGDLAPTNDASRLATSLYALISIPMLFFSIGILGEVVFARYHDKAMASSRRRKR